MPSNVMDRVLRRVALTLLRENLTGGHWVTISGQGATTHIYISHGSAGNGEKGQVIAGPKHLLGANIAHLPPAPEFHHTEHPDGHTPEGAREHPDYDVHAFKHFVVASGKWEPKPIPSLSAGQVRSGFDLAHARSKTSPSDKPSWEKKMEQDRAKRAAATSAKKATGGTVAPPKKTVSPRAPSVPEEGPTGKPIQPMTHVPGQGSAHIDPHNARQSRALMYGLNHAANGTPLSDGQKARTSAIAIGKYLASVPVDDVNYVMDHLQLDSWQSDLPPRERLAYNMLRSWVENSSLSDAASYLQMATAEEFGLPTRGAAAFHGIEDVPGMDSALQKAQAHMTNPRIARTMRALAFGIYSHTQDVLKQHGLTHITVARGANDLKSETMRHAYNAAQAKKSGSTAIIDLPAGDVAMNPISSWSTAPEVTEDFVSGNEPSRPKVGHTVNATLLATVPAEHVFSLAGSGIGDADEDEVMLIGHPTPMVALAGPEDSSTLRDSMSILRNGRVPSHPDNPALKAQAGSKATGVRLPKGSTAQGNGMDESLSHGTSLREALTGGHWVTITDDEGVDTHLYISHGGGSNGKAGQVIAGPKHLIGANIAHLPPAPHFRSTEHPSGHEPANAKGHPSYAEHQFTKRVYGQHGPGIGKEVDNPLEEMSEQQAHAGFDLAHAQSRKAAGKEGPAPTKEQMAAKAAAAKQAAKTPAELKDAIKQARDAKQITTNQAKGLLYDLEWEEEGVADELDALIKQHAAKGAAVTKAKDDTDKMLTAKAAGSSVPLPPVGQRDFLSGHYFKGTGYGDVTYTGASSLHFKSQAEHIAAARESFHKATGIDASMDDIIALSGAPSGSSVQIAPAVGGVPFTITAKNKTLGTEQIRAFSNGSHGPEIYNQEFTVKGPKKGGVGARALALQVATARRLGFTKMSTDAAGTGIKNTTFDENDWYGDGYIVWPKLGYNATLSAEARKILPDGLKGAKTVMELMVSPAGRKHWEERGTPGHMTFSLADGSASLAFHDAYNKARGIYVTPRAADLQESIGLAVSLREHQRDGETFESAMQEEDWSFLDRLQHLFPKVYGDIPSKDATQRRRVHVDAAHDHVNNALIKGNITCEHGEHLHKSIENGGIHPLDIPGSIKNAMEKGRRSPAAGR